MIKKKEMMIMMIMMMMMMIKMKTMSQQSHDSSSSTWIPQCLSVHPEDNISQYDLTALEKHRLKCEDII
jgi:hypothetical protein